MMKTLSLGRSHILEKVGEYAALGLAFAIPVSTALTSCLVAVVLLSWFFGPNVALKRAIFFRHPLVKWIFPLVILVLVGTVYSGGEGINIWRAVIDGLRLALIPILMYYYSSEKNAQLALVAFSAAMVLTLVLAYLKVYADLPIGLKYTTGAIFKSHIKTSYFMAIVAFFMCYQMRKKTALKPLYAILVALMVYYLLFMSVGRIGYLTLILCMVVLAWQTYRLRGILTASFLAVVVLLGAYWGSDLFHQRVDLLAQDFSHYRQGNLESNSLGSRLQFAELSAQLMAKKPLLGWGTGSFGAAYALAHQGEAIVETDNPHNEYLRIGVELGALGLALLLSLFYQQWRLSRELPDDIRALFRGILITFVVGCLLNSWLRDFTESYFFCLMTAICFSQFPMSVSLRAQDEH